MAYDTSGGEPALAWDANTRLSNRDWWDRRIYVGGYDADIVRIRIDPRTKAITNASTLRAMGLGETDEEAALVAKFIMGVPASGKPNILGAIIHSTPIDVAAPGQSPLPGGQAFYRAFANRPGLVYVGSSDGLLHAFFTEDVQADGTVYMAGDEALA